MEKEIRVGDKVTCKPDTKYRGGVAKEIEGDRIKVKWYPGPQTRWMSKAKVVLSEKWNNGR